MKKKEVHTFYNFQFKHTAVRVTNHPYIQASHVADALEIHPVMLYRWKQEMRDFDCDSIVGQSFLWQKG